MKIAKVGVSLPELVERFKELGKNVQRYVFGRDDEITALMICLLTKQHLLLEGKPGIAKSRFALLAFRMFSDAKVFEVIMSGQMTTDDVFGLTNPKLLREQGIHEYNVKGKLPDADFAYLDELFKAPGIVLDSTLNLIHERVFFNGNRKLKVPLKTIVATTNQVDTSGELEAFLDRFLITRKTKPADSDDARLKILQMFQEADDTDAVVFDDTLSLKELERLQLAIKKVKVPDEFISFMMRIREEYVRTSGVYISDRRLCWMLRSIQAAIFIEANGEYVTDPTFDCLTAIADVLSRNPEDITKIQSIIGTHYTVLERERKESDEIKEIEEQVKKFLTKYDDLVTDTQKEKFLVRLVETITQMSAIRPEDQFTTASCVDRFRKKLQELNELRLQVEKDLKVAQTP